MTDPSKTDLLILCAESSHFGARKGNRFWGLVFGVSADELAASCRDAFELNKTMV